jgi:uncharacterized glyoxalase superfamily protein PhnB
MNAHTKPTGTSVIPTVRYRDVPAAIEWLRKAFALEQHRVVKDQNGTALYGELTFGSGMVMVAPIQESAFGKLMVQPDEIGGVETQICYLFVKDAKAHYARAKAAGAEIVLDIEVEANGGRGYSCRDPEGHVWNFGTYDPWDLQSVASRRSGRPRRKRRLLAACFLLALAGGGIYMHEPAQEVASDLAHMAFIRVVAAIESAQAEQGQAANETADHTLREVREQLSKERIARLAADRHVKDIREQLVQERRSREAAELTAKESREGRAQDQGSSAALKAAESAAIQARDDLAQLRGALEVAAEQLELARSAKETAERGAKEAREQLAQLRNAKETVERAAREAREQAMRERSARIAAERAVAKTKGPYLFQ